MGAGSGTGDCSLRLHPGLNPEFALSNVETIIHQLSDMVPPRDDAVEDGASRQQSFPPAPEATQKSEADLEQAALRDEVLELREQLAASAAEMKKIKAELSSSQARVTILSAALGSKSKQVEQMQAALDKASLVAQGGADAQGTRGLTWTRPANNADNAVCRSRRAKSLSGEADMARRFIRSRRGDPASSLSSTCPSIPEPVEVPTALHLFYDTFTQPTISPPIKPVIPSRSRPGGISGGDMDHMM